MAYKNQNYMTNYFIKELADKEQKDYVAEQEETVPEQKEPIVYSFSSYDDDQGTTLWGTGTVKTTGVEENGYTQVEVVTNEPEESFVGLKFYIVSTANEDSETFYELFTDAGETSANIYIKFSKVEESS